MERLSSPEVIIERGQHDNAGPRQATSYDCGRLNPPNPRHLDVHEHHIRRKLLRKVNSTRTVPSLADNRDALQLQELSEGLAAVDAVANKQHAWLLA